jgi:hypothetical protein
VLCVSVHTDQYSTAVRLFVLPRAVSYKDFSTVRRILHNNNTSLMTHTYRVVEASENRDVAERSPCRIGQNTGISAELRHRENAPLFMLLLYIIQNREMELFRTELH